MLSVLQFLFFLLIIVAFGIAVISALTWFAYRFGALLDYCVSLARAWETFFLIVRIHTNEARYRAFIQYLAEHEVQIRADLEMLKVKIQKQSENGSDA